MTIVHDTDRNDRLLRMELDRLFAARLCILDIFDTIQRFSAAESAILEYISPESIEDNENLNQLCKQFVKISEELAAKV